MLPGGPPAKLDQPRTGPERGDLTDFIVLLYIASSFLIVVVVVVVMIALRVRPSMALMKRSFESSSGVSATIEKPASNGLLRETWLRCRWVDGEGHRDPPVCSRFEPAVAAD